MAAVRERSAPPPRDRCEVGTRREKHVVTASKGRPSWASCPREGRRRKRWAMWGPLPQLVTLMASTRVLLTTARLPPLYLVYVPAWRGGSPRGRHRRGRRTCSG